MLSNNKILTVSYGTFSCTLEGFDDSFGTMKAIAEYFRDLAADDRYFGAEPPQPDAQMLARIAQKEISRRVEARQHEGKIVLSAYNDDSAASDHMPVTQPATNPAEELRKTEQVEAPAANTSAPDQDAADSDADVASTEPDTAVTAGTSDAIVESAEAVAPDVDAAQADDDEPAQEPAAVSPAQDEDAPDKISAVAEDDAPEARAEAFFATMEDEAETAADVETDPTVAPTVRPYAKDSIAAKLQRIRAVVARQDNEDDGDDDYAEDEDAAAESIFHDDVIDEEEDKTDNAAAWQTDDVKEAQKGEPLPDFAKDQESDDDDIAAIMGRLEQSEDDNAEPAAEDVLHDDTDDQDVDNHDLAANLFQDDAEEPVTPARAAHINKITAAEGLRIEIEKPEPGEDTAPRARVIKVKRVDLEAAVEKGDLVEHDDQPDHKPAQSPASSLSAEDEDDLARELAALEAELYGRATEPDAEPADVSEPVLSSDTQDAEMQTHAETAAQPERTSDHEDTTARDRLPAIDEENSADVKRLMAETDHQMDEPESATRRDAFAHLRAAVAAKKADDALGTAQGEKDEDDAYRQDLNEVVRPRRPVSNASRTARPTEARPAPLKLVAEQRIDTPARPAGPVRPRRVSAVVESPSSAEDAESFVDFAAEMGATRLPDLLEAAAAYMSFVEGREQFSRPQLMNKVRQIGPEGFTREDGLRSFGQLLRMGKIEKIKGGRFTASDDIGFRPDSRAVG